jgi:hypothetical protein
VATEQAVAAAVDRAVETATVDPEAPQEPRDERVRYDPEALDAVIRLCTSDRSRELVLAMVDRALWRWIDALDTDRTLAAMILVHRVEAATTPHPVVVENLQGDVGTGRGPQVPPDRE